MFCKLEEYNLRNNRTTNMGRSILLAMLVEFMYDHMYL